MDIYIFWMEIGVEIIQWGNRAELLSAVCYIQIAGAAIFR